MARKLAIEAVINSSKVRTLLTDHGMSKADSDHISKVLDTRGTGAALAELYAAGWMIVSRSVKGVERLFLKKAGRHDQLTEMEYNEIKNM